jgi:16S rRNA (adenine1518-N6/adenine1519-N6)-dimethyltransferase
VTLTDLRQLLRQLDLRPRRTWGQNFLVDGNILRILLEQADVRADEVVLEVGPGLGVLTEPLLDRARRVVAIEKDRRLCAYLRERFPGLTLIEGDALQVSLPSFDKLVANLPYSIATPLLERVVELPRPPRAAIVMLQREVAERLTARPRSKAYGALTVLTQFRYDAHIAHLVAPGCFYPPPAVESAVVVLLRRDPRVPLTPGAPLRDVVRAGFGHRRKMLGKLLRPFGTIPEPLASRRAEELSVADWIELANRLRR